jgi:hypothetical protein
VVVELIPRPRDVDDVSWALFSLLTRSRRDLAEVGSRSPGGRWWALPAFVYEGRSSRQGAVVVLVVHICRWRWRWVYRLSN